MTARTTGPAVAGLVGAAAWLGPGAAAHRPRLARVLGIPLRLRQADQRVALTFDDGPHPEGTPAVLRALDQAGAHATFFLVGEQVERYPALAAEIVAAGHEPAVHGYRHRNQMRLTPRTLADDTRRALAAIAVACGRRPRLYRPPYGAFTPAGLALLGRLDLEPLLWSRWGRDWRPGMTPERIALLAGSGIVAGDVVLLHDADWYGSPGCHRHTAAALPRLLAIATDRGLRAVCAGAV